MSKHYELPLVIQLPRQIKTKDTEAQNRERGLAGAARGRLNGTGVDGALLLKPLLKCIGNNLAPVAGCHQAPVQPCIRLYWGVS